MCALDTATIRRLLTHLPHGESRGPASCACLWHRLPLLSFSWLAPAAAAAGHVAVAAKLLDAGADANLANDSGKIPLHYHKGSVAIIDLLLPHTKDVDAKVRPTAVLAWVACRRRLSADVAHLG